MNQTKKSGYIGYEDLLRELASLEQQILPENGSLAMELMALEAKIRDRFQKYQNRTGEIPDPFEDLMLPFKNELSYDEIKSLIPQDLNIFDAMEQLEERREKKKKILETVGIAAFLAVVTALGIFGLASVLQLVLNWLA